MQVIQKSSSGTQSFPLDAMLLAQRTVFLTGEINTSTVNAIIQQHLSDCDFGVEDIGKEIGLSRVQLYRKIKAMTGSSVVDILRKARLAKGKRLLENRSMTIAEVAYEVGFSAPSYFTKCFKDEYGMLPGDIANS